MKIIAVTMVYNEGPRLNRWLDYYGRNLGRENLLIVDHGSTDGSTSSIAPSGLLPLPRTEFDDILRTQFLNDLQRNLFKFYDAVIYTDCDEIIIPDPNSYAGLRDYVERMPDEVARPIGIDLFERRGIDQKLVDDCSVLAQRSFGVFRSVLCKPLITRVAIRWLPGFHHCDRMVLPDPSIVLFHTKNVDQEFAKARQTVTRDMAWSSRSLESGMGQHQRATEDQMIQAQFDQPTNAFRNRGAKEFSSFQSEIEAFRSSLQEVNGFYRCAAFAGDIYSVPERYWTKF
jgi:hypothetical protein